MRKRGLSIRKALTVFYVLSVVLVIGVLVLGVKLTTKISEMNEVKAAMIELKETKVGQVQNLEVLSEEIETISEKLNTMQVNLEQIREEADSKGEEVVQELKYAYLTFDDGPSENTMKILDFLKANNIKATFFVIGTNGYDNVYKRIVDEGHTLAIHSNTHVYSQIYTSVNAFMQDIDTLANKLEKITGVKPSIMRFPGGSNNTVSHKYGGEDVMDKLIQEVNKSGYAYFDWNVDSSDASAVCQDKNVIFNSVMDGVEGKHHAIILMHDAAAKTTTVEALPEIVEGLRKKGFVLAPITEDTPLIHFK